MSSTFKAIAAAFGSISRYVYPHAETKLINPGKTQIKVDGVFNSDSFLPNGHLKIRPILRTLDLTHLLSWREPHSFLDAMALGCLKFGTSLKLDIQPELYSTQSGDLKQPVQVTTDLVFVGNSSYKIRSKLYVPGVTKPVAEKDYAVVMVDPDTRRPKVHPAWWRDKHAPYSRPGEGRIPLPPFDFNAWPGRWQNEQIYVQTDDVDVNRHCNFTSYVCFCYEAYGRSQFRQFGPTPKGDPFRDIKSLVCAFKGEAGLGDLLSVFFMQDPVEEDTYHFQILNKSEKAIFECHVTFYPHQVISKI